MPTRDVVVVGASAGGVDALKSFVAALPADLPACVLVVLHVPATSTSALPLILSRAGNLPAQHAVEGAALHRGRIYVAPPGQHLLVRQDRLRLGVGPRENGHRPAIDVLFRSAARWFGPRVIAVVLSGTLDDGAAGAITVVERGGRVLVQDPADADYRSMPAATAIAVPQAKAASASELGRLVATLAAEEIDETDQPPVDPDLDLETAVAELDESAHDDPDRPGHPAGISCPDCHGTMFEIEEGSVVRYRCRVGHAWSPESLLAEQVEAAEAALWMAIRTLEEKAALHRRIAGSDRPAGERARNYHEELASEARNSAAVIRELLRSPRLAQHESADFA